MNQRRNILALAALGGLVAGAAHGQSRKTVELAAVGTLRDLLALPTATSRQLAIVGGYHAEGDGGGGLLVWQPASLDIADGGLVFAPEGADRAGRWVRILDGPIDVRMFGARGDGKTDDTAAIQAAIDSAAGAEVRIPAGTWVITRTLHYRAPAFRHSPGLKLIGEGSGATVIDCRIADGPAISIEQARGYNFGKHGMLRDLELVALNSPPGRNQHGIVLSGAWLYRFDRIIVRSFRGHGIMVPFIGDRGGTYTDVDVVAGSNIIRREAGDFRGTLNHMEVAVGEGIAPDSFVEALIDDKTVRLTKPALKSGRVTVSIWGKNTDGQTTILSCVDCQFIWNGGWGIYNEAYWALELTLRGSALGQNQLGGLRTGGWVDMYGGSVADNGTPDGKGIGILIDAPGTRVVDLVSLESVEIDGNHGVNLWLRRVRFARITRCRFNSGEREKVGSTWPAVSVRLGDSDGSGARTVEFSKNMMRADGVHNWPHTAFEIPDGASVENLVVTDSIFWGGWNDAHHTRFRIGKLSNPGARLHFDVEGVPAAGLPVPAPFVAQLKTKNAQPIAAGAASVMQFKSVNSNLPRIALVWEMEPLGEVSTGADGTVGLRAAMRSVRVGMPLLLLGGEAATPVAGFAKVAAVPDPQTVKCDRPLAVSDRRPAIAGGVACPYEGYFALEVVVDILAGDRAQPISLMLLADGKPWRTETGLLHGLAQPQTLRLSLVDRWAAGTAFHVLVSNHSSAAVTLQHAAVTLRLLA